MPVQNLTNADLKQLMAAEPALLLLDVRTPPEYDQLGHIPGAKLMPVQVLADEMSALSPTQTTVVICEHGVRSHDASQYLVYKGFSNVYQLTAGMADWDGEREFA